MSTFGDIRRNGNTPQLDPKDVRIRELERLVSELKSELAEAKAQVETLTSLLDGPGPLSQGDRAHSPTPSPPIDDGFDLDRSHSFPGSFPGRSRANSLPRFTAPEPGPSRHAQRPTPEPIPMMEEPPFTAVPPPPMPMESPVEMIAPEESPRRRKPRQSGARAHSPPPWAQPAAPPPPTDELPEIPAGRPPPARQARFDDSFDDLPDNPPDSSFDGLPEFPPGHPAAAGPGAGGGSGRRGEGSSRFNPYASDDLPERPPGGRVRQGPTCGISGCGNPPFQRGAKYCNNDHRK